MADVHEWLKDAIDVESEELERIRRIPTRWNELDWRPFPDAGWYQMTRLTHELTNGACNSYYIKLSSGEAFPVHRHPNAVHIMQAVQGEGSICWRESAAHPKYRAVFKPESGVYAITPDTEHAILADRGSDLVFLVINSPAEDLHRHNYQVHV